MNPETLDFLMVLALALGVTISGVAICYAGAWIAHNDETDKE